MGTRILPKRVTQGEMEDLPIQDGNLIFNTTDKRIYMDDEDGTRYQYGGTNEVDQDFNVSSLNSISNKTVTKLITEKQIELTTTGWSTQAPFKQEVEVDGMTVKCLPEVTLVISDEQNESNHKLLQKNFNYIKFYDTKNGGIVFTCKYKKPTVNLPILLKGIY